GIRLRSLDEKTLILVHPWSLGRGQGSVITEFTDCEEGGRGDGRELTRELIRDRGPITPARRFEWTVVALCTWLMAGAYLDAWAHRHLARLETFFTPWHGGLYSGIFAILLFLGVRALRNQGRGHRLEQALPACSNLSLFGAGLFGIAGVITMCCHLRCAIELPLRSLRTT